MANLSIFAQEEREGERERVSEEVPSSFRSAIRMQSTLDRSLGDLLLPRTLSTIRLYRSWEGRSHKARGEVEITHFHAQLMGLLAKSRVDHSGGGNETDAANNAIKAAGKMNDS